MVDDRADILGTDEGEKAGIDDDRQQQVEKRAGRHNHDLLEHVLVGERIGYHLRCELGIGFITHHLDVAPQWDGGNAVVGHPHGPAEQARPEAKREFLHTDAKEPGNEEVAQLMEGNENAENDDKGKNISGHRRYVNAPAGGSAQGPSLWPSGPPR